MCDHVQNLEASSQNWQELLFLDDFGEETAVRIHVIAPFKRSSIPPSYALSESSLSLPSAPFLRSKSSGGQETASKLPLQEQFLAKFINRVWEVAPKTSFSAFGGSGSDDAGQVAKQMEQLFVMLSQ